MTPNLKFPLIKFTFNPVVVNQKYNNGPKTPIIRVLPPPIKNEPHPSSLTSPNSKDANISLKDDTFFKKYADVILVSLDQKQFPTYRYILSKHSSVFEGIFNQKSETPITVDVSFAGEIIQAALDFYIDKIDSMVGKETEVLSFADKYAFTELKVCKLSLISSNSPNHKLNF